MCRKPFYPHARVVGIRKARRADQPAPNSEAEALLWELERQDRKLRAVAIGYIDEFCDQKQLSRRLVGLGIRATPPRSYIHDRRYQRVLRLQSQIVEQRAEIERRLPQPEGLDAAAPGRGTAAKILRRALNPARK